MGRRHNGKRLDDLLEDYSICYSASIRTAVGGLPVADPARAAWDNSDRAWKRNLLELLIDRVTIKPSNVSSLKASELYKGWWRFRPEHVEISWLR